MRDIRFLLKTHYTNSRALIIGINRYKTASPLSYAVNDAQGIRDVLLKEMGFLSESVTCLFDDEATRENIIRAFLDYTGDNVELDERILVFFAGHGYTRTGIRGEVGYLVPHDADLVDSSTLIRWDDLTRNAELVRAKHMLFIMDACYGGLALTRNIHSGSTRFLKDMMLRYSRQVLTAGKADEVVSDSGGPLPGHSVFTGHLIEGLRGKAVTQQGLLTASGLMSYVYGKVASDPKSNQTPHYGYFDGDGDFILSSPQLADLEKAQDKDLDRLFVVPFADDEPLRDLPQERVKKVKLLLASESLSIELHDFVVEEVKRFLARSGEDFFRVEGRFSQEELLDRLARYDELVGDLSILVACLAYWAKQIHLPILQKVLSRSSDRLDSRGGIVAWLSLRWYPLIIELYCGGIAAVENRRYDSLASMFYARVGASRYPREEEYFVEAIAGEILELLQANVFNQLPGHERHHVPMSEYLFKALQPRLDDALFIGKNYSRSFDEFEVIFALAVVDLRAQRGDHIWVPVGRFGWKQRQSDAPLSRLLNEARVAGENWQPLKAGLFGGSLSRFTSAAEALEQWIGRLNWW